MNIQINTKEKTIKLAETVNLKELEEVLIKFFPNNEWREYNLETNTIINNWTSPIIIQRDYPWTFPNYFVGTAGDTYSEGLYNLSVN